MYFKKLSIYDWQQFKAVEINFHDKLTILTGANASGKTTILNLLARHCGWNAVSIATPQKNKKTLVWEWISRLIKPSNDTNENIIGELVYGNDHKSNLQIPDNNSPQYQISIPNQQNVKCFNIPSHRSIFRYETISNIPISGAPNKMQAFEKVSNITKSHYFGGGGQSSSFCMKETLISWSIFGRGNEDMEADETLINYYRGFEKVLKKVLPKSLGFQQFKIRKYEIVLICDSSSFLIDAASGGISAIIDIAWQIFMFSTKENDDFTVLIDEVENHLHPTMQRQILPDLINAFPNARFIVSTHNPLVVGSVRNSKVYILKYNEENTIISEYLDLINEAKTASEILDEVLGVSHTLPIWAKEELDKIINKYMKQPINKEIFKNMRKDLSEIGLEKYLPEAINDVIENNND